MKNLPTGKTKYGLEVRHFSTEELEHLKMNDTPKSDPICPECGKPGKHFVVRPDFLMREMLFGDTSTDNDGFWVCEKFYDENGRRKES